jgi:hypothetical protein
MKALRIVLKIILIGIVSKVGLVLLIIFANSVSGLYNTCRHYFHQKEFAAKYEFEDFSRFNNTSVFIRGGDRERNLVGIIHAPHLVNDSSKRGSCIVKFDRKSRQLIQADWMTEPYVNADTVMLRHLSETFMNYKIVKLTVDTVSNVFVYLKDFETLGLVRFANENERQKSTRKWRRVRGNWYKPR